MKSIQAKATRILSSPQIAAVSLMVALPLLSLASQQADARVYQALGACDGAQAQFIGTPKKGRAQLTSFGGPTSIAGFVLENTEGIAISALRITQVYYEGPVDLTSYDAVIHVSVQRAGKPNLVQNFKLVASEEAGTLELPTRPLKQDGSERALSFSGDDLLEHSTKLKSDDRIGKLSFFFHAKKGAVPTATRLFIDSVGYGGEPAPVLLEPVTCNLR
ncbi:MAG TPA: hypothetical protein V6C76_16085 [Drouetiella sp.]